MPGKILGWLVAAGVTLGMGASAEAANWQTAAFGGSVVSLVVTDLQHPGELAAVAAGGLQLSHDGGANWVASWPPNLVQSLAYDPVMPGWLYAGTTAGLYVSRDAGLSWRLLESSVTNHKITVAVCADAGNVFAAMYDGAGTPTRLWRFGRDGRVSDTNLPSGNAGSCSYDLGRRRLYVGAAGGVYSTGDEGGSWQGGGGGAGQFTLAVVAKPDALWQLSPDGLFRSLDEGATWNRLADPGHLNNTYYGSDMHVSGLAVNHGRAFYGDWSFGYPYKFLAEYSAAAYSILDARIYAVADGGSRLWAATDRGLLVSDDIIGSEAMVRRPLVLIPGILGSLPTGQSLARYFGNVATGHWGGSADPPLVLDPVYHTYDGLIASLEAHGYELGRTLFLFPYDWMQDNAVTAGRLGAKLAEIRKICACAQVDVAAHSMGGLVARVYVQGAEYAGDISNLIELGTPNSGAVGAYSVWEGGTDSDLGIGPGSGLLNLVITALTEPVMAPERALAVRRLLPSVQQLLPIFDYLAGRHYPGGYPTNPFLEQLNRGGSQLLRQRVAYYAVGSQSRGTPSELTVGVPDLKLAAWPDGAILSQRSGAGDGTVLADSLGALGSVNAWFDADHGGIVTAAAGWIERLLMEGYVADEAPISPAVQSTVAVAASGPAALQVTDPLGRRINDQTIEVPGAFYTGSGAVPQLVSLPDAGVGVYHLTLSGVGSGSYTLMAANLPGGEGGVLVGTVGGVPALASGSLTVGRQLEFTYDVATRVLAPVSPPTSGSTPDSVGDTMAASSSESPPTDQPVQPDAAATPASMLPGPQAIPLALGFPLRLPTAGSRLTAWLVVVLSCLAIAALIRRIRGP